jgi:hypothetical protein
VWVDETTDQVVRSSLAFGNHNIYGLDNGRVVGYDNAHGYHHRHFKETVESINLISFEDIEAWFQRDWLALRDET